MPKKPTKQAADDPYGLKRVPRAELMKEYGRRIGALSKGKSGRAASCGHDYDPNCAQCKVTMRGNKRGCGNHFKDGCRLCKQRKLRRLRREAGKDK